MLLNMGKKSGEKDKEHSKEWLLNTDPDARLYYITYGNFMRTQWSEMSPGPIGEWGHLRLSTEMTF